MKAEIHPTLHETQVTCACGNTFTTLSTAKEIKTETCSECHPFFTGTQRFVDTAGRIEKFQRKFNQRKSVDDVVKEEETVAAEALPAEG